MKYIIQAPAAECAKLCSTKNYCSMARQCGSEDMLKFQPEALCQEWKDKGPLF